MLKKVKPIKLEKKIWQWAVLILLAFIWGSSFILMKRGLTSYNHTTVAALRITIASLFLLPFVFKYFKTVNYRDWKFLALSGFLGNGIPSFLFTLAQTKISSSVSGMLNSLTPISALIIGVLLFKNKAKTTQVIGVIIGLIGAAGLILSNGIDINNTNLSYSFYVVLATICYGLSVNIIKNYLKDVNPIAITALAFFTILPFTLMYLVFGTNFFNEINTTYKEPSLYYIIILAVIGTAISVIVFNILIKKVSTLFATSVTYLIPAFAIFWGLFDGEILTIYHVFSLLTTLLGIYFINKST